MHKFIEWLFASFINIEKFLRIVCVFFIMLLSLYWIQNLIGASWWWLGFIAPLLDYILDSVNSIYSFSFDFWGKAIEIKYFNALLLMLIIIFGLKVINLGLEKLHEMYEDAHFLYKKNKEALFNKGLQSTIRNEEKQLNSYSLFIQTRVTKRYINKPNAVDIDAENEKICNILNEKLKTIPVKTWGGLAYSLKNFEDIDSVLEILFTMINSQIPVDFIFCIQIGNSTSNLKQLVDLQEWGKIIIAADTLCRYRYNNSKKYKTTNVGIFQRKEGILEVHEFVEKL